MCPDKLSLIQIIEVTGAACTCIGIGVTLLIGIPTLILNSRLFVKKPAKKSRRTKK